MVNDMYTTHELSDENPAQQQRRSLWGFAFVLGGLLLITLASFMIHHQNNWLQEIYTTDMVLAQTTQASSLPRMAEPLHWALWLVVFAGSASMFVIMIILVRVLGRHFRPPEPRQPPTDYSDAWAMGRDRVADSYKDTGDTDT